MKTAGRIIEYYTEDTQFNLALEESILRLHSTTGHVMTLRFWRNPSSVIIGRGQDIRKEVELEYCRKNGIEIARRISGGGSVYHDMGNLNISIFTPKKLLEREHDIVYVQRFFCDLIVESLQEMGFAVTRRDNTNIVYNERKISGAAAYFTKDYVLYHATLLHSSDLNRLESSLIHNSGEERLRSSYQPTTNLKELDLITWKRRFIQKVQTAFNVEFEEIGPHADEIELAKKLTTVYSQHEWVFKGSRPKILFS